MGEQLRWRWDAGGKGAKKPVNQEDEEGGRVARVAHEELM